MIRNAIIFGAFLLALAGCEGTFDNQKKDNVALAPPGIPAAAPMELAPIVIPEVAKPPPAPPPKRGVKRQIPASLVTCLSAKCIQVQNVWRIAIQTGR